VRWCCLILLCAVLIVIFWGIFMRYLVVCFTAWLIASVAYSHEWDIFAAEKIDNKKCECGGITPCDCGDNCKCKTLQSKKPGYRVLLFTASWCGPCQQWKQSELPALKAAGWDAGKAGTNHIQYINCDTQQQLVEQYGVSSIPQFIAIRSDGSEVARGGYMQPRAFTDFYYGNQPKADK